MLIFLVMILLLVIAIAILMHCQRTEGFYVSNDVTLYTTNQLNHIRWITEVGGKEWDLQNVTPSSATSIYKIILANRAFPDTILPNEKSILWTASEIEYEQFFKPIGKGQLIASKKAHFVALGIPEKLYYTECAFDMKGKKVGYFDTTDRLFLLSIIHAYRMPLSSVELVQVPMEVWDKLNKFMLDNDVDFIAVHIIPNSALQSLIQTQYVAVMGWGRIDIDRVRVFNPFLVKEEIDLKGMFISGDRNASSLVMDREKRGPVISTNIGIYALNRFAPAMTSEGFITRLAIEDDTYDPAYRCYGDLSIEQKALCVSPFNQQGDPKKIPNKWDRPCIEDSDCPFFRANTNYANTRGGCLKGGICEMPVGVLRTAFRTYDAEGINTPFCYGCDDASDISCCAKQKEPDYAFANDFDEREKVGLSTFVSVI